MNSPDLVNRPPGTSVYARCKTCKGDVYNHLRAFGRASIRMNSEMGRAKISGDFQKAQWDEPPMYQCIKCEMSSHCVADLTETCAIGYTNKKIHVWNGRGWVEQVTKIVWSAKEV